MKSYGLAVIALILIILLAGCTAGRTGTRSAGTEPVRLEGNRTQDTAEFERMQKMIVDAVKEAEETGATEVDVFLDEDPDTIEIKDLVTVNYTATLENGLAISGPDQVTEKIIAGKETKVPGLGSSVLGLHNSMKKKAVIEPEKAFGRYDDRRIQSFPSVRTYPVQMEIPVKAYEEKFGRMPKPDEDIVINPYFKSRINHVTGDTVYIRNEAQDGHTEGAPFGKTSIQVEGDTIYISLAPAIGAAFPVGEQTGLIVSAQDNFFKVDYNHPFAGQKLYLDIEVLSFQKASALKKIAIPWIDDFNFGMKIAKEKNKPTVLILYADWCQWCKKLFNESLNDPRIKLLKDKFVWIKANSDENQSLKEMFQQKGFPMVVFSDLQGQVIKKFEGYKDPESLLAELELILNPKLAKADR